MHNSSNASSRQRAKFVERELDITHCEIQSNIVRARNALLAAGCPTSGQVSTFRPTKCSLSLNLATGLARPFAFARSANQSARCCVRTDLLLAAARLAGSQNQINQLAAENIWLLSRNSRHRPEHALAKRVAQLERRAGAPMLAS